jgi:Bacterial Ig-like domain (group 2)
MNVRQALALAFAGVVLLSGACGDEPSGPTSTSTSTGGGRVAELTLSQPPILRVGQTAQVVAQARFVDGRAVEVTSSARWTSSELAVATVSQSGLVTAVRNGISTVTASYQDATGSVLVNVFVPPPPMSLAPR